ncbi:DUF2243 domain-containing protein [Falsiroseomonas bella]|uniref:DUF2243 domain-containing protein n=1 Tax=Falsiroseomonas bella TaxID=2184016 RepID=A0A317FC24_9PROT|nr:DUF2243 domain-containing protein [Falsiroseomonas bella]PWS36641.1 DUF2243 domain-containing protein [Falsiroseomonas bella]
MPHELRLPAFLLGFALGGFFDGILFHQILQWHHLLSLWAPEEGMPFHVVWDGLFHAAHYAVAVFGLGLLWQHREGIAAPRAGRGLVAWAWIGFGAWHILDVVLNHWVLGMHRARIGVANPLAYDMIFVALGVVGLMLGWLLLRRPGSGARGAPVATGLAILLFATAPVAALPPRDPDPAIASLLGGRLLPAFCASWARVDYAAR